MVNRGVNSLIPSQFSILNAMASTSSSTFKLLQPLEYSNYSTCYEFIKNFDWKKYLLLIFKVFSIQTVRYFKCSNPLWMVLSSLNCHLSHTSQLTKVHLYPLFHVVCSGRPGSSLTSTSRTIDPCIAGPVVCIPLRRAGIWKWLVSISLLEKTNHSSLSIKRQSQKASIFKKYLQPQ